MDSSEWPPARIMVVNDSGYWVQVDDGTAHSGEPIRGAMWMHRAPHAFHPRVHVMVRGGFDGRLVEGPDSGLSGYIANDMDSFAYILETDREWLQWR